MTRLFTKLNLKPSTPMVVINAPASFEPELAALNSVPITRDPAAVRTLPFVLAFVTRLDEINQIVPIIESKASGDAIVWFAYPKASSKTYHCEFNRDTGWTALGTAGFEPVRQVAIDSDWSALRFRRVEFIKNMKRKTRLGMDPATFAKQ